MFHFFRKTTLDFVKFIYFGNIKKIDFVDPYYGRLF
jgi:hypothetical protein